MLLKVDTSQLSNYVFPEFEGKEGAGEIIPKPESEEAKNATFTHRANAFSLNRFNEDEEKTVYKEFEDQKKREENEKIELSGSFKANDFIPQNSLLTDAQNYAESIREGARLYAEQLSQEAESRYQQAERTFQEAKEVKAQAEEEKKKLLREAQQMVEKIHADAYQEGFKQGHEDGMQKRYDEAEPLVHQIEGVLETLARMRQVLRFQSEQELLQMAVLIAKRVVLEELSVNPKVIYNALQTIMREIETLGKIRVMINPGDFDFLIKAKTNLEKYLKDEQVLTMKADIDVAPGNLLIETDETVINFTFKKQFDDIEEALSRILRDRQAHLYAVDIDQFDFETLPPNANNDLDPT